MLIDWFTVVAQALNFILLVWLLKRFLYKPVLTAIDAREKKIAEQIAEATKKRDDAEKERVDFQQKIEQFNQDRAAALMKVQTEAASERSKLSEAARHDADELRSKLEQSVTEEAHLVSQKLAGLIQVEVFSLTTKILADLADTQFNERLVDIFIVRLEHLSDPERAALQACLIPGDRVALIQSAFDLSEPKKREIETALNLIVKPSPQFEYEVHPDLMSGLELVANGQKIAWSVTDYLKTLNEAVNGIVKAQADAR